MDFAALSQHCAPGVSHQTMAAIVKTESGFRPLAIGINGGEKLTRQPNNKAEAVVTANWLISNGYNIDLGLGQINSNNLSRYGLSVDDAFDPCANLSVAASILTASYKLALSKGHAEQPALYAAISAYNTGSLSRGFGNGYVQRVVNNVGPFDRNDSVESLQPIPIQSLKTAKWLGHVSKKQAIREPVTATIKTTNSLFKEPNEPSETTKNAMVY